MDHFDDRAPSDPNSRRARPGDIPDILKKILRRKRQEIAEKKAHLPGDTIVSRAKDVPPPRLFADALRARIETGGDAVIAELKRASPSKGLLREDFDPAAIAASYERGGATALSVLTDRDFFRGADEFIDIVKENCRLPVLRKEFVIDPWQVHESRALGADCVLLIAAALEDGLMSELAALALDLGMDVLVEVHDASELARVPPLDGLILGVNNRDLRTFDTTLDTTLSLLGRIPVRLAAGDRERHSNPGRRGADAPQRRARLSRGRNVHARSRPGRGAVTPLYTLPRLRPEPRIRRRVPSARAA